MPVVEAQGTFAFQSDLQGVRLAVSWVSKQQGIICDLDLNAFFYDERVSTIADNIPAELTVLCRLDSVEKWMPARGCPRMGPAS